MKLKLFLWMCLWLSVTNLTAQEDLRQYEPFFAAQQASYKKWLTSNGLDTLIGLPRLQVRRNKVFLTLQLKPLANANMIVAWQEAKNDFEQQFGIDLADRLFYRAISLLELSPQQLELIIIGQRGNNQLPELSLRIKATGPGNQLTYIGNFRQEEYARDTLPAFLFDTTVRKKLFLAPDSLKEQTSYLLHRALRDSMRAYFAPRVAAANTKPQLGTVKPARISVKNLKGEVVDPSSLSWLNPHEYLEITLSVKPEPAGLAIYCIIDGRVGISFWEPRSLAAFHDMKPRHQRALQNYVSNFLQTKVVPWTTNFLAQQ